MEDSNIFYSTLAHVSTDLVIFCTIDTIIYVYMQLATLVT